MNPKGVKLLALRSRGNRSLVYVYREKQLVRNLNRPGVARFLKNTDMKIQNRDSAWHY